MDFTGKRALITGGVSGIGFGIARAFAEAGIGLVLTYRDAKHRDAAARWFAEHGHPTPLFLHLDVTDRARWAEVAVEAGAIHILVNNAGVSVFGPTDAASHADYDWIMGVNFGGAVNGLVAMLPGMKARAAEAFSRKRLAARNPENAPTSNVGHVVNVASMAAFCAGPQAGIYTASKFALRGLTECLRYNLAPYHIGVALMCPGLTATNAWDSALKRPAEFSDSGFAPADRAELASFGEGFALGMDPLEVGRKTLAGMRANRGLILTHPDHREDFLEIHAELMAALPDEPIPEGRAHIEHLRREANRAAAAGMQIGLGDLT